MTAVTKTVIPNAEPALLEKLRRKIAGQRVPFTGAFELTHRCQLRCVHCYGGDQTQIRRAARKELTASQWLRLADEAADAGCVDLLLTGGEPLMRPDFPPIFEHVKKRGFVVTVFTNGFHIDERVRALFFDWPPFLVEITLYGATAETHEKVTQVPGSFRKTLKNVELLVAGGVRVGLKTVLMSLNAAEAGEVEKLAAELGVPWRLDAAVFSCLSRADSAGRANRCAFGGAQSDPTQWRLDPREAAAIECRNDARRRALSDTWNAWKGRRAETDGLYTCGAGLTGFHIDPYGWMQPCLMVTGLRANAVELGFRRAWAKMADIRRVVAPPDFPCRRCELMPLCSGCPAFFELESGDAAQPSGYICALARARYQNITGRTDKHDAEQG